MAPFFTGIARGVGGFGFGRSAGSVPFSVTGGTKYTYNGKTIHVFTSTDATGLVITGGNLTNVEYVMVGGGGAGGYNYAGGGGAGGYLTGTFALIPGPGGPYPVTIGAGGNGVSTNSRGGNGTNTVFNSITAYGGGGGGFFNGGGPDGSDGTPGASGGGAGGSNVYQTVGGTGNRHQHLYQHKEILEHKDMHLSIMLLGDREAALAQQRHLLFQDQVLDMMLPQVG
jgi:hypothetical protein